MSDGPRFVIEKARTVAAPATDDVGESVIERSENGRSRSGSEIELLLKKGS